jgi:predicted acetyltransferase
MNPPTDLLNFLSDLGYFLRKIHRGEGLGQLSLKLGLDKLREFGVSQALITIYPENQVSIKVTAALGGVYQDTIYHEASEQQINRYWIDLE